MPSFATWALLAICSFACRFSECVARHVHNSPRSARSNLNLTGNDSKMQNVTPQKSFEGSDYASLVVHRTSQSFTKLDSMVNQSTSPSVHQPLRARLSDWSPTASGEKHIFRHVQIFKVMLFKQSRQQPVCSQNTSMPHQAWLRWLSTGQEMLQTCQLQSKS